MLLLGLGSEVVARRKGFQISLSDPQSSSLGLVLPIMGFLLLLLLFIYLFLNFPLQYYIDFSKSESSGTKVVTIFETNWKMYFSTIR